MATTTAAPSLLGKYLPVYFALLGIFALEVVLAYRHFPVSSLVFILLVLAVCSAMLGVMFFMHLAQERRSLLLSLIIAVVFVLTMMTMILSDGYRLFYLKPFPQ
jgi:caa(3)-type oxidase subunit IV